jgi:hypothetical protein
MFEIKPDNTIVKDEVDKLYNDIRKTLKECDISHIDAIILLCQVQDMIFRFLHNHELDKTLEEDLNECPSEVVKQFAMSLRLNSIIQENLVIICKKFEKQGGKNAT